MKKPSQDRRFRSKKHKAPSTDRARRGRHFLREISVLYEDDAVIAINKPAGLLAVPIKGSKTPSALSVLTENLERRHQHALIVHRIDRFASGILLFAKTQSDRIALVRQFLKHEPKREYLAVVRGVLEDESGTLVHYFRRAGMLQQLRSARDPEAARAELHYSVKRSFADATLVRIDLVTGLQNQIRAQFAAIGHPIVGDRKYHESESAEPLINRVALHAAGLEFTHPRTGNEISIHCKLPGDFLHLVQELAANHR